jgi:glycosyltransferase involved in cell wall biosynthesis
MKAVDGSLRALVVAYNFPPVGGAGVQRMSKLVKYLPSQGIRPSVLTVANPSVPLTDASLEGDLPDGLEVTRARTLEPGYALKQAAWQNTTTRTLRRRVISTMTSAAKTALIPDPQVLWLPAAELALAGRLRRNQDDVMLVSAPPFSQFLLAPLARARRGVGVVLDYRDEWSTTRTTYEMMGSSAARLAGDVLEPAMLRCAHRVTTATEEFREELLRRYRFLDPGRVTCIPNGFDPDDYPSTLPSPPADRFVVTYAGTVFKLTSARGFLDAVRKLHVEEPELARLLHVRFLGRIVETERDAFEGTEALGVTTHGYVPHGEVLASLSASHLTLCILDDVPNVERIYPAKIFELMYLGRPVLVLSPEGALTRLARRHHLGDVVPPRDVDAIARVLAARLRAFAAGSSEARVEAARSAAVDVDAYDRRALAARFADVMREAARDAGRTRSA